MIGSKRGWVVESSRLRICPKRGRRFESYRLHFYHVKEFIFFLLSSAKRINDQHAFRYPLNASLWLIKKMLPSKKTSATENWTRVSCVTGRDNSHYTIADQLNLSPHRPLYTPSPPKPSINIHTNNFNNCSQSSMKGRAREFNLTRDRNLS